ncbi:MAG TPA: hypothetical protein VF733_03215 [Candidatus Saccharimonadales bacterium]
MGGHHNEPGWLRIVFVVLLFSITVLAIAIAISLYFGKNKEAKYVIKDKYQAVFLTNGQVYFGKLNRVHDSFVDLQEIYYLNSQQQPESGNKNEAQQTSFSLVKLGCELHGPADQMIINRDQISFWENLKTDGKVAKAIEQFKSQNPNGQSCNETSNSTQQSQSTTNNSTTTSNNTSTTTNSKKQ